MSADRICQAIVLAALIFIAFELHQIMLAGQRIDIRMFGQTQPQPSVAQSVPPYPMTGKKF